MNRPRRRASWLLLSIAIAGVLGLVAVGALALVAIGLVFLSQSIDVGTWARVGGGLAVVFASILFGALCGVLVGSETVKDDAFVALLILGSSVIGAGAGAFAFATRSIGLIALAGLFGATGAIVATRAAARFYVWLRDSDEKLPEELRRFLP